MPINDANMPYDDDYIDMNMYVLPNVICLKYICLYDDDYDSPGWDAPHAPYDDWLWDMGIWLYDMYECHVWMPPLWPTAH